MTGSRHDWRDRQAGQLPRRVSLAGLASALVALAGCSIGLAGAAEGAAEISDAGLGANVFDAGTAGLDARKVGTAPATPVDAAATDKDAGTVMLGASPLCGVTTDEDGSVACNPDVGICIPETGSDAGIDAAEYGSFDAGDYFEDAGYPYLDAGSWEDATIAVALDAGVGTPTTGSACRVTAVRGEAGVGAVAPVCSAAGTGTSESTCYASSDCSAGFECVAAAQTDAAALAGICRHYCCMNQCGAGTSCQIEGTIGGGSVVPVCVPNSASGGSSGGGCELLNDTTCQSGYTCQIVNETSGQVACLVPGTATAGESCETMNCAAGLSCIAGVFPNRTCAQLCTDDGCPSGQTCLANTALSDTSNANIGVCTL